MASYGLWSPPSWSANVVTPDWVELRLYLPWFPYHPDHGRFTFELTVRCDPDYQVRSLGEPTRDGEAWRFSWPEATSDDQAFGRSLTGSIPRRSCRSTTSCGNRNVW